MFTMRFRFRFIKPVELRWDQVLIFVVDQCVIRKKLLLVSMSFNAILEHTEIEKNNIGKKMAYKLGIMTNNKTYRISKSKIMIRYEILN